MREMTFVWLMHPQPCPGQFVFRCLGKTYLGGSRAVARSGDRQQEAALEWGLTHRKKHFSIDPNK